MNVLAADWLAPPTVKAFTTTRGGGISESPFDNLNLGAHVGDDSERVRTNRQLIREAQGWSGDPLWLHQVHGASVVRAEDFPVSFGTPALPPQADGAVTRLVDRPLVVMTADCLPVAVCDKAGTVAGVFHAGWRGLLAGILERGLAALEHPADDLLVWIGPSIGPDSYQVGDEVRQAYLSNDPNHEAEFIPDGPGHWKFDLAGAAVRRLAAAGVGAVTRSRWDTFGDTDLFFSHRKHAPCGRMGTFICLQKGGRS